ncbi:MAG: restriction endonuclease [Acidobacteria bacterium]|jgi:hypothetical protein|nr:restriction endonuclease [Acidobacteriota bacterium]
MKEEETPKWKKFERLIAALHLAEQKGATVKWNDEINERQFDVTIRFNEAFYEYLTVIECKNYSIPVPVKEVEAFVTKSRRVKADKAVMFSTSGFQSGAKKVASDEKISLFSLLNVPQLSSDDLAKRFLPYICIFYFFRFKLLEKNSFIAIPEEPKVLRNLMRSNGIVGPEINTNPEKLVEQYKDLVKSSASEITQTFEIEFPESTELVHMNGLARDKIKSFLFDYCLVPISKLKTTKGIGIDHYLLGDVCELKDEINNKTQIIDTSQYQLGFDTQVEIGKFYVNPNLDFYYYCAAIDENLAEMWLIESYQNGGLFQAAGIILDSKNTTQFVEITKKEEIERLRLIYGELKEKQEKNE